MRRQRPPDVPISNAPSCARARMRAPLARDGVPRECHVLPRSSVLNTASESRTPSSVTTDASARRADSPAVAIRNTDPTRGSDSVLTHVAPPSADRATSPGTPSRTAPGSADGASTSSVAGGPPRPKGAEVDHVVPPSFDLSKSARSAPFPIAAYIALPRMSDSKMANTPNPMVVEVPATNRHD